MFLRLPSAAIVVRTGRVTHTTITLHVNLKPRRSYHYDCWLCQKYIPTQQEDIATPCIQLRYASPLLLSIRRRLQLCKNLLELRLDLE